MKSRSVFYQPATVAMGSPLHTIRKKSKKVDKRLEKWMEELREDERNFYGHTQLPNARWAQLLHQLRLPLEVDSFTPKRFPTQALAFADAEDRNKASALDQFFVFAVEIGMQNIEIHISNTLNRFRREKRV